MIIPVILAGGSGTRLWPMSREMLPKQFLRLTNDNTMIQNTVLRTLEYPGMGPPMIFCNHQHGFIAAGQLQEIGVTPGSIFLEPVGRNTAPAVAIAAIEASEDFVDALILLLPADHLIEDIGAFYEALEKAEYFARSDSLVTFGIIPDRPETGYGYIRKGEPRDIMRNGNLKHPEAAYSIAEFVEKPDIETAYSYLVSGDYCWNSGMFLFKAKQILSELNIFVPSIMTACMMAHEKAERSDPFVTLESKAFEKCPSDSIDYAVMERTKDGVMVPFEAGWNDIGSWEALWNVGEKDDNENAIKGDVVCINASNCLIHSKSRLVTVSEIENIVVIETPDAVLVSSLNKTQGVKRVVNTLKEEGRQETRLHDSMDYPWGRIEIVEARADCCIRRITVNPGQHVVYDQGDNGKRQWMVLNGAAELIMKESSQQLFEGSSIRIDSFTKVQCHCAGPEPLVVIEAVTKIPGEIQKEDKG